MPTLLGTVSTGATAAGGAASFTFSHTVASGSDRATVFRIANSGNVAVSGVTYGGVAAAQVPGADSAAGSSFIRTDIWRLVAPAVSTADVVVTFASSARGCAQAATYSGVHQTTPHGTAAAAGGSSLTPSVAVTSAAGELVVDIAATRDETKTLTPGAGQTEEPAGGFVGASGAGSTSVQAAASREDGAASVTMSWTNSVSSSWAISAVPLKPATGGASGALLLRRRREG